MIGWPARTAGGACPEQTPLADSRTRGSASQVVEREVEARAVNCHHNYISRERHYDENVIVTRKGAVRARLGELGILPGSVGPSRSSFAARGTRRAARARAAR